MGLGKKLATALVCVSAASLALAAGGDSPAPGGVPPQNHALVKAWLQFPGLERVAWPHAYIRARTTRRSAQKLRRGLFVEFRRLRWRLSARGDTEFAHAVAAWRRRLASASTFRTPGQWSPGWLMAHPNQNPPLRAIEALGGCEVPAWITLWDQNGVQKIRWRPGLDLFGLIENHPALAQGPATRVAVVTPQGRVDHYGTAAFNAANTELAPGSRVVAALPLRGQAFAWIRDRIAAVLAHVPSGARCREVRIKRNPAGG